VQEQQRRAAAARDGVHPHAPGIGVDDPKTGEKPRL
jgi:hypothetical protein